MEAKNTWKHGFWVRGIKSLWKKGPWPNTLVPLPCDFDSSFFHLSTNELRHNQVFWRPDFSERLTDPQGTMSLYGCHGRGMGVDTLLYLRWMTSEDAQHSADSARLKRQPDGRGFGGEWIHVHMWLRPFMFTWNDYNVVNWRYPNTK